MNIINFCESILFNGDLESKLQSPDIVDCFDFREGNTPLVPARSTQLEMSEKRQKFPKVGNFKNELVRGQALHFFANHELLAIEMMAAAIIKCGNQKTKEFKQVAKGILHAIKEEQKHLRLYINRMNEFGVEFGDYPLNDFFWRQLSEINSFDDFFATMSLTFEAANLDFADFYQKIFSEIGDKKTANILKIVYEDELTHVKLGSFWLNKWKENKDLWSYYLDHLPEGITPARSKGIAYQESHRKKAGLSSDFIFNLTHYRDDFAITRRKN